MTADLRLAGAATGAWLTALGCLYLPAAVGFALAAGFATMAAALGIWAQATRRQWRWQWIALAVLIGAGCGAIGTAARVSARDAAPLAELTRAHATVYMRLKVTDDPHPLHAAAGRQASYAIPVSVSLIRSADRREIRLAARALVLATDPAWRSLLPGTPIAASGRLLPPRGGDLTAAVLSTSAPPDEVGPAPWTQRAAGALRAGLRRACAPLPAQPGGLLPGLVDGDTSRLDPALADDFQATGMTHLNAVSGANCAIILSAALLLARWCRAGPRLAGVLCAVALVGFVILVRPSPSVLRAAAMGALSLLALVFGRPRAAVPGLAAAVLGLILFDPGLAASVGFALSVFATGGLLLFAPGWRDVLRQHGVPAGLAEALAVPAAAQVACAPVIAGISGTVSLVAIPANLLAEPAVAPATILGVAAALASVVWPAAAAFLAWLGCWPARWLVGIARFGAAAPDGVLPWPGGTLGALGLAVLLVIAVLVSRRPAVRIAAAVCALAAVLGAVPVRLVTSGWPPAGALIVVCDVGQGDAIVLPVAPGRAVLVDTGPEPTATDRCLHTLGIHEVLLLVITHFHADHVGGIAGAFHGRRVDQVATTSFDEPPAGFRDVLATAARTRTPVITPTLGWTWAAAAIRLTVIGPVDRLTGTDSDPNNNSLIVLATIGTVRVLLTGDAEVEEQTAVLAAAGAQALRADVLKVAHHGSAYQDPAFLDAVHPSVAMVSVGLGNPYGHPNLPTLARLRRAGARVLRTDIDGDVAAVRVGTGFATIRRGVPIGRHPS